MKKLLYFVLLVPTLLFAQEEKKAVNSHKVTKGFYGNLTVNQMSPIDETVNGKLTAGMHFSGFHIGAHYITSFGENEVNIDRIVKNFETDIKYSGFGLDLMYEFDLDEKFSVAPFINTSLMKYEFTSLEFSDLSDDILDVSIAPGSRDDNFLNTQIGAKLFFTPNKNFKVGIDVGYNMANGVDVFMTENDDLSGMNIGLTVQFNHFYPKW